VRDNAAFAEDKNFVADLLDYFEDMRAVEDHLAAPGEGAKETAENHSSVHVEARERFVEDKDLGVVEQRSYEENFLAHPFGIAGQGGVTVFPETDELEKLVHFGFEDVPG
jgi:hypothetical protein